MNIYITAHSTDFLEWQRRAIARHRPDATVHIVATANASSDVLREASLHLPAMQTRHLVSLLLPHLAPGPGMVMEWDMVPVAPVASENAIATAEGYGLYPSVVKWLDPGVFAGAASAEDVAQRLGFATLPQEFITTGCGAGQRFQMVGDEILHYHYHALYREPCGFDDSRKRCWLELMAEHLGVESASKAYENCGPGLARKAFNFASSAAKHLVAGMPRCTDEQVAARFAICRACEHFDGKACRQCGCPVVRERQFVSKLSWANESCPVGKWGPVLG